MLDQRDSKETVDLEDALVVLEGLEPTESKDQEERRDPSEHLVCKDHQDCQETPVSKDQLDLLVNRDHKEHQDQTERLDQKETR